MKVPDLDDYANLLERSDRPISTTMAFVRLLSGLLPICSSCKRIRDDEGSWRQIEEYIGAHSEATFTHGICPECARRLYPRSFEDDIA